MRAVLLTRPLPSATELQAQLQRAGLTVLHFPTLALQSVVQAEHEAMVRAHWAQYTGIILVSQHAAYFAHTHLQRLHLALPERVWLGAVGQGTLSTLKQLWPEHAAFITPDVADSQDSEGLWRAICTHQKHLSNAPASKILLIRAQSGRDLLLNLAAQAQIECDVWACYQRGAVQWSEAQNAQCKELLSLAPLIVITSIEGLDALLEQPCIQGANRSHTLVTIHPRIAQYAHELGFNDVRLCTPDALAIQLPIWAQTPSN